jgi:hypothetical protein
MKERFIAQHLEDARVVIGNLLELSCRFEVTPFPDDKYEIVTKAEGHLACAGVSMDRIKLLSIHKPCSNYEEDPFICDMGGEPKGQCANCGEKWFHHDLNALPESDRESARLIQAECRL